MTEQLGTTVSRLPVLPLRGLVAFPNMIIHFDVGRLPVSYTHLTLPTN